MKNIKINYLKLSILIGTIFLIAAFVHGCKDDGASLQMSLPEVKVITVAKEDITITTNLTGRTAPYLIAEVRPQVNGIILERLFVEGSYVTQDMPLYQIDDSIYKAELANAEALLKKAQANLEVTETNNARHEILIQNKAISKRELEDSVAALKQAQAEVAIAQAQVDTAKIRLNYTKVLSPISGRIGKSNITPGALVTANQSRELAVVQQLDPIYVDVTQSSTELMQLRREMGVEVKNLKEAKDAKIKLILTDGSFYKHEGTLQFSDVTVDQTTDSIILRAIFPNPDLELLPGMYVRAELETANRSNSVLLPQQAVSRDKAGEATVVVAKDDGTAEKRVVTTIRTVGNRWLIAGGVQLGEKIVVEGFQRLRFIPGAPAPRISIVSTNVEAEKVAAKGDVPVAEIKKKE